MLLKGVSVLDIGHGIAGAYCTKLLRDMGADVWRYCSNEQDEADEPDSNELFERYLNAGKCVLGTLDEIDARGAAFDIIVIAESANRSQIGDLDANVAILDISWFGADGPYAQWQGSDLIVQALAGLVFQLGPKEGPPMFMGEHQATLLAGVSGYCAALAQLIGGRSSPPLELELSILESILVLSELQICNSEQLGMKLPRLGVNRFLPTCPVSIHRCKQGWIGVTPLTPDQWRSFCNILGLPDMAEDPDLLPGRTRYPFADRIEKALDQRFPSKTANEWAELGRKQKIPMVVVPNAEGILEHPIFNERESFAQFTYNGQIFKVPRTPFRLEQSPPRTQLDNIDSTDLAQDSVVHSGDSNLTAESPLAGIRVIDFSMGWAGPLATRMLADLGAEVIKIEAGRYPDWWRAVDWSADAIARKQYEESRHFSALNRGKASISLDLTQEDGRALAKQLVSRAQVVVENQAAGVMDRLGLGFSDLGENRDDLIMLSMSAFGAGNAWSETRAYGSVLDQGSGLPSFVGEQSWPPTLAHIAYGDPVGGVYGAASLLSAIYHRQQSGQGQWINNTQIEAMLPFTSASLLIRQATGEEPRRLGNGHRTMTPHGVFKCAGDDAWVAIAVQSDYAWQSLVELLQADGALAASLAALGSDERRAIEAKLLAEIEAWTISRSPETVADALQARGITAAPVLPITEVTSLAHLRQREAFYDINRDHVGDQSQVGLPFTIQSKRYPMRGLAPLFGADTHRLLKALADVADAHFDQLLAGGVVDLAPTQLRKG